MQDVMFVNALKTFTIQSSTAIPASFNSDGYPTGTTGSGVLGVFYIPPTFCTASVHCIVDWQGTQGTSGTPGVQFLAPTTIYAGSSFISGSTSINTFTFGTNGSVEFSWVTPPAAMRTLQFNAATYIGLANLRVYACLPTCAAAAATLNANPYAFNPDFIGKVQAGKWSIGHDENLSWNLSATMVWSDPEQGPAADTALSYIGDYWPPALWGGTISGTNTYAVTCSNPCSFTLTDGAMIQGQFTNANTSSTVTLTINGGSPIAMVNSSAVAIPISPASGSIAANAKWTCTYDAALVELICASGASHPMPTNVLIALANTANVHLWHNFLTHGTDTSVIAFASKVCGGQLNSQLNLYAEYADEVWNFSYPSTSWAIARGAALGLPTAALSIVQQAYGFYGLRTIQIRNDINSACGSNNPRIKSVMAFQAAGATAGINTYRFQGHDLCGTSCGNATYAASGLPDYNVAPNRPVDISNVFSYAQYTNGPVLNSGTSYTGIFATADLSGCSVPLTNSGGLQCMADNFNSGDTTDAFAWIDNDIRHGTKNGTLGGSTLLAFTQNGGVIPAWNTINATGNTGGTAYNLPIIFYESSMQDLAPTIAQCQASPINGVNATLGTDASTYCNTIVGGQITNAGLIQVALNAYKQSALFQTYVTDHMQALGNSNPVSGSMPAWFELCSLFGFIGDQWAQCTTTLYGTFYTSYNAIQAFN